ncbi:hypothetical protein MPTK1_7g15620 [Marchantia polymorpha subsp. ruderalis]|uniref:Chromatin target of PRMT1 protein C-terminal domain-containing protein n=2 Tax=Marchantia polymorpha TaxID=3197 RepID=A0AAF6C014_MARPO|nr:hypothetical protein MARPO_0111s0057 [Marchantia polymorpha]BBN17598.1 hypothetical protein Mp_7g15620 [Marchantia polymorpha subsp. ruderalis]|eukprot:PTQ31504.1 hypothetical protein MARPO_0111s0057 [Marchantia polymorpha]
MQGGRGGGGRQGYNARGNGSAGANHLNAAAGAGNVAYGGMPGYFFNPWLGFNAYNVQGLMPLPPVPSRTYNNSNHRGSASGASAAFVPLGVQGAGILKRPSGSPQGPLAHGHRRHSRGHGGRSWGSRGRKEKNSANLTKEALDADLDEWRMKDKKLGSNSLDADLDEYWKKKNEMEAEQDEEGDDDVDDETNDSKSKLVAEGSSGPRREASAAKDDKVASRNGYKDSAKAEKS